MEELERSALDMAAETKCNYFITGGDWDAEFFTSDGTAQRAMTQRA